MGAVTSRLLDRRNTNARTEETNIKSKEQTSRQVRRDVQTAQQSAKADDLVFTRRGSMFRDEYGDVAHEFYEEVQGPNGKVTIRQTTERMVRQGGIPYSTARLKHSYHKVISDV